MAIDIHAPIKLSAVASTARAAMHWWTRELASAVPEKWRTGVSRLFPTPRIEIGREIWTLTGIGRDLDGAIVHSGDALDAAAEAAEGRVTEVRLGSADVLIRRLSLPAGASARVSDVAALQIDRLSPLPREQTRWAARSAETPGESASVAIVDAARIDPIVARLREGGFRRFVIRDAAGRYDLHVEDADARLRRLSMLALVAAGFLMLVGGIVLEASRANERIAVVEQEIAALKPEAEAVAALRREVQTSADLSTKLNAALGGPTPLDVWAGLAVALPDGAWLTAFEIENGAVRLEGFAQDPAEALAALVESGLLDGPRFDGALQRNQDLGADRFVIRARLKAQAS